MFCGRNSVAAGSVEHDHAAPGRGFHIDIVHADTGATDHAQTYPGIQDLCGNFRLASDDDPIELRDKIDKFRLTLTRFHHGCDRPVAGEFFNAASSNRIGDENFW